MPFVATRRPDDPEAWAVSDGRTIAATFSGDRAEVRAREYAQHRNRGDRTPAVPDREERLAHVRRAR